MTDLTNIFARSIKDLTLLPQLPDDLTVLGQVKIPVGNLPVGLNGCEALSIQQLRTLVYSTLNQDIIAIEQKVDSQLLETQQLVNTKLLETQELVDSKLLENQGLVDTKLLETKTTVDSQLSENKTYTNQALSQLSTVANKFYPTLAAANADIAKIAVNQGVQVGEYGTNGGLWYKATASATILIKSPYDPVTQSKEYVDLKIATTDIPSWVNSHNGVLPLLDVDLINNRVWTPTKMGSLSDFFIQNIDGSYTIKQMPDGLNSGYSIVCKIKAPNKTATISGVAFSIITTGTNNSESYLSFKNAPLNRAVSAVFGGRGSASSLATKSIYGNDIYALTRDVNAVKYYVENNKESEQASSVTDSTYLKPTNFAIGKSLYPSSPANATNFIIERVTIYNSALNSSTINSLMTNLSELKKPTTPILEYPSWLMKVKAADGSIKVPSFQFNEKTKQCWFNGAVRNIDDVAPLAASGIRVFKTRPYGLDVNKGYTLLNDVTLPFTWTHANNPITGYAICACESTNNVRLRAYQTVVSNTAADGGSFTFNGYIQSVGDMVPRSSANRPSSIGGSGPAGHRGRGIYRGSVSVPATGPLLTGLNGRPVLVTSRSTTQQTAYPDYWVLGGDSDLTNKVTNCEVISTVIFSEALTQDELQQAQCFTPENYPILFFMGDSFNNLSQTSDATLAHLAKSGLGYIPVMHDGQGGKGLNYQRDLINGWLDAYPYLKKSILVLNEGGFDTVSDTPTSTVVQGPFSQRDIINFIDEMVERFDDKRLIYMHCQTNSGYTEDIKAFMANIKRTYPDAFCDATGLLQSAFPTDAEYEAAILTGATPSFLRSDDFHISWGNLVKSESGYYYWGLAIARKLKQLLINSN